MIGIDGTYVKQMKSKAKYIGDYVRERFKCCLVREFQTVVIIFLALILFNE